MIVCRDENGLQEYALIELQGDLKPNSPNERQKCIGDLHFTKAGLPILIIGIHVLQGKESTLDKPIAILEKKRYSRDGSLIAKGNKEVPERVEFTVKAIVTKKIIFRNRPKTIVVKTP